MLLIYTLECLYSLSSLGEKACNCIVRVHGAIDTLVSLITVEVNKLLLLLACKWFILATYIVILYKLISGCKYWKWDPNINYTTVFFMILVTV